MYPNSLSQCRRDKMEMYISGPWKTQRKVVFDWQFSRLFYSIIPPHIVQKANIRYHDVSKSLRVITMVRLLVNNNVLFLRGVTKTSYSNAEIF